MIYSYYIGVFGNLSLNTMPWVFLSIIVWLVMIGASIWMAYNIETAKKKALVSLVYIFVWLLFGGIVGFVIAALTQFITFAFVSDFTKDYS